MNKYWLRIQMWFCAWSARYWDDAFIIALRPYDCSLHLAEYINPRIYRCRKRHEAWCTRYLWLERKYRRKPCLKKPHD